MRSRSNPARPNIWRLSILIRVPSTGPRGVSGGHRVLIAAAPSGEAGQLGQPILVGLDRASQSFRRRVRSSSRRTRAPARRWPPPELGHIDVAVHPVDALHLEHHMDR